ncbi:hypothetical protein ADK65_16605 [Streptomyces sp. NRRL B-1140]|uniref:hypothetical protein n=1 Tax=Streptomyces sp. NRRL B-1140 TaxID=1415549 RepID=UPI0006B05F31|nr:hypothetical protein [Streptomyces sp. NRRL B-1140]KOW00093.1 hypothetical protein ADK65_16605 [Streptomyces sp. NRRL B-1140]
MRLRIAELCESLLLALLRSLLPARGRHRTVSAPQRPSVLTHSPPVPTPRPPEPLLMDSPLVRPYLRAEEVFV